MKIKIQREHYIFAAAILGTILICSVVVVLNNQRISLQKARQSATQQAERLKKLEADSKSMKESQEKKASEPTAQPIQPTAAPTSTTTTYVKPVDPCDYVKRQQLIDITNQGIASDQASTDAAITSYRSYNLPELEIQAAILQAQVEHKNFVDQLQANLRINLLSVGCTS